jgi:2-succinyl-5-enolpyruvyl-6-hydroxy-3-cyclohexene-1-carboxylate synthase
VTGGNPTVAAARVWIDELARCGVRELCLAPGSRSAPLAMAALDDGRIRVHVRIDERSASFLALGLARGSGIPVALTCTSGTAAANFLPAVIEADRDRVPLIVLTADRPPELRHTAANQTIDQVKLYGMAVRWFCELGVPEDLPSSVGFWRSTAARAWAEATGVGGPAGPVHVNLAFREPLVHDSGPVLSHPLDGRDGGAPWVAAVRAARPPAHAAVAWLRTAVARARRPVLVVGGGAGDPEPLVRLAGLLDWPLVAEAHSGARQGEQAVPHHDLLLRHRPFAEGHRPDLAVVVGRVGLSKALLGWLAEAEEQVLVDRDGWWLDPGRSTSRMIAADPSLVAAALEAGESGADARWSHQWVQAGSRVADAVRRVLADAEGPNEPAVARDLAAALPGGAVLTVASSMPIRDLDTFMAPRSGIRLVANRGASGIDGFVSTAVGVALAHDGPAYALAGDLSLLHDQNGLLIPASEPRPDLVLVVANNDGGGIFSFLPQAEHLGGRDRGAFERAFGTPHGVDLSAVAYAAGCGHARVDEAAGLPRAVEKAAAAGGVQLVEVRTDRGTNRALHVRLAEAAVEALEAPPAG